MATITNTYFTFSTIGNREDLIDIIFNLSPNDTPFSAAIGKNKANKLAMAAAVPGVQQIIITSQAQADVLPANVVTPADIRAGNAPPLTGTKA